MSRAKVEPAGHSPDQREAHGNHGARRGGGQHSIVTEEPLEWVQTVNSTGKRMAGSSGTGCSRASRSLVWLEPAMYVGVGDDEWN